MKKILSMILITVMAMSIFCAIPASAAVTHSTRYFFDDFEDGTCTKSEVAYGASTANTAVEVVNGGYDGSAKAVKAKASTGGNARINFGDLDTNWLIGVDETISVNFKFKYTAITSGQIEGAARSSFSVYMFCAKKSGDVNVGISADGKLLSDGTVGTSGTWNVYVVDQTKSWQDVSFSWTNKTGKAVTLNRTDGGVCIGTNFWPGIGAEFLIDDVEIKISNASNSTNAPVVSGASAKLSSYTVKYDYAFTSPAGGTDASVIKLRDGNAVIGSYSAGDSITVPSAYIKSDNLNLEIIPIDSKNNVAEKSTTVAISGAESYTVLDFSDGQTHDVGTGSGYRAAFTNEGAGGTKGALNVSVTEDNASPAFDVALRKGYSYDISMWIKAKQAIKNSKVTVIFNQEIDSTSSPSKVYYEKELELDGSLAQGEWVYAHGTIENYNGKATAIVGGISGLYDVLPLGVMYIKIGDGTIANTVSSGNTLGYSIDDLTVMPRAYKVNQTPEDIGSGLTLATFDGAASDSITTSFNDDGWRIYNAAATIVPTSGETPVKINGETLGGTSGNGGYVKITNKSLNFAALRKKVNLIDGVDYGVRFWAKGDSTSVIGVKTPKGYVSRTYVDGTSGAEVKMVLTSVTDLNGTTSTDSADFNLTSEWRVYEAKISLETASSSVMQSAALNFRVENADGSLKDAEWSMGNFKMWQISNEKHLIPSGSCEAFKTGDGTYNVDYSSKVPTGSIERAITRIMVPYKNSYVIGHLADDISNEGTIQLQSSTLDGAKMLVNAKDGLHYYGDTLEVTVRQPETPNVTVVAEFDQTVWGKDMDKLTATVYYNNLSGESTLNALCATYDENNKLITSDVKPLLLSNGEGQVKLSMSATAESKKARVFFWDENYSPIKSDTTPIERNDDANFIYVSTKGTEGAEGGFKTPVATIEEALEKQKSLASSKDTYIVLMQGNHAQTKELKITNEHTANGKLIITSYDKNDKGVISGGYDLTGKFNKEYKDGIYYAEIELSDFGLTHAPRDLFVNGTRATKARSKDLTNEIIKSTVTFEKKHKSPAWGDNKETIVKDYGHLESTDLSLLDYDKKWKNENEYEYDLEFVFSALWTNHRCQVKDMKKSTRTNEDGTTEDIVIITMDDEGWKSMCDQTSTMGTCTWDETTYETISSVAYPPRYMENALELLDEEGEWYIDFKEGLDRVYYKPRTDLGESIETIEVILPVVDNYKECLVNIEGTKESNVNYLTFDNVTFAHTTWTRPSTELGNHDRQANKFNNSVDPEGAVDIRYASNVTIENCDFTKLGISGLRLVKGVKNCDILGNEFYDIAGGAAILGLTAEKGEGDSERYSFRNPDAGDEVDTVNFKNNYIHHVAVEYKGAAAVTIGYPSNSLVAHNEIAFIPYSGIHMGYEWNRRINGETRTNLTTDIKNNYFHDLFYSGIYDGGAIYTLGLTGGTSEDQLEISGNYTERIGAGAATYYNDQGSTHYYVHDNVSDLSDSKAEVCYTTGKSNGVSNCMNINMDTTASTYEHYLTWSENYTNISKDFRSAHVVKDGTISCEDTIVVNDLKADPKTKAIIDNAGIEPEYRNNFRSGLQNIMVIDEITLSVGERVNNTPFYITGKTTEYKNNALYCYVSSSNPSVVTATESQITAVAQGEAIITYTVLENGIYRTVTTKVTVE